ncbi:MAG: dihydrofolate reductase family protein [Micrococcales bacterium]|nr:dihydrofolate reductase family protein [Micrococcales bacterium]
MRERPYILVSCGMSIDGYLATSAPTRLLLSNEADFDRVDGERAACDAILVGAVTIRKDNPRLLVRSPVRRAARIARGDPPSPMKVTVTRSADLDRAARFFSAGDTDKLVYCETQAFAEARDRLGSVSTVIDAGHPVAMREVCEDLHARGVRRLMIEGGAAVHTQVLEGDLADELQLVIAPFFVGDSDARRFVGDGSFPWNPRRRAALVEARQIEDVVLLRYALSSRFRER